MFDQEIRQNTQYETPNQVSKKVNRTAKIALDKQNEILEVDDYQES